MLDMKKDTGMELVTNVKCLQEDIKTLKDTVKLSQTDEKESQNNCTRNKCSQCHMSFQSKENLKYHIASRHPKILKC